MIKTIYISTENALRLFDLKSSADRLENSNSLADFAMSQAAFQAFSHYAQQIGVEDTLDAIRVANTVWGSLDAIHEMQKNGVAQLMIPIDHDSHYLLTVQPASRQVA